MKNLFLVFLSLFELLSSILIFSLILGFLYVAKIDLSEFTNQLTNFKIIDFIDYTFYSFINLLFMEGFKILLLIFFFILIYNLLIEKKILSNKFIVSIIYFNCLYIILNIIVDSNFYTKDFSNTINSLVSLSLVSILISIISSMSIKAFSKNKLKPSS